MKSETHAQTRSVRTLYESFFRNIRGTKKLAFDDLELDGLDFPAHFRQQVLLPHLQVGAGGNSAGVAEADCLLAS